LNRTMGNGFSGYTENEVLEWLVKNTDMPVSPSNIYVSLHTADEGENPDGSNEVGAADYSRASTSAGDWSVGGSDGPTTVDNANEISFGDPQNNWGSITHFALWDASTGGNPLIATIPLNSSKSVDASTDELKFSAGAFTIDLE